MTNYQEKSSTNQRMSCPDDEVSDNSIQIKQMVQSQRSNSLLDPDENVFLSSSSNHHSHDSPTVNSEVQLVDSPTRSLRRGRSIVSEDSDFQVVSHKKTKSLNNHGDNNIHPHMTRPEHATSMAADNVIMNINNPVSNSENANINHLIPNDQQRFITSASARYALTRYPFPPHIVRFNSNKISICLFKDDIVKHFKSNHDVNIEIVNCRLSSFKCSNSEVDILLYVKDSYSFALLLDHSKWLSTICGEAFRFPSTPSIPPQLSLIIKNVDLSLDFVEFTNEIKNINPNVENVIRMKNKFGNCIKLVKLELISPKAREELLNKKKICVNYIRYEVDEYLAPVNVLICSKCCGLGHFRRQCTEQAVTCKSCGQSFIDLKDHSCAATPRCKHCNGEHLSNSMKCPVVKSFRSELTRKMFNMNSTSLSSTSAVRSNSINNTFHHTSFDFPRLAAPWASSNSPMDLKLNDLISGLTRVNETLTKLCETNKGFQQFIIDKNDRDMKIDKEVEHLKTISGKTDSDVLLLKENYQAVEKSMKSYDLMFNQFLFPVLDDILKFIGTLNVGKNGKPLDADLRSKLERFRVQVSKAIDGKTFV